MKGVSQIRWKPHGMAWLARIDWHKRPVFLGSYHDPEEAACVSSWARHWMRPDKPPPLGPLPASCPPARLVERLLGCSVPLWALVAGTPVEVLVEAGCTVESLLAAGLDPDEARRLKRPLSCIDTLGGMAHNVGSSSVPPPPLLHTEVDRGKRSS